MAMSSQREIQGSDEDLSAVLRHASRLNAERQFAQAIELIDRSRQTRSRDFVTQGFLELEMARALSNTGDLRRSQQEGWSAAHRALATFKWDLFLQTARFFLSLASSRKMPSVWALFIWRTITWTLANPLLSHRGWQIWHQIAEWRTPPMKPVGARPVLVKPGRIAVVRLDRLGDLVGSLPAFTALRRSLPEAHITAFVSSGLEFVIEQAGVADRVIGVTARPRALLRKAAKAVSAERFDVLIDLLEADRSWEIDFVAQVNAGVKIGFESRSRRKSYHILVPRGPSSLHVSQLTLQALTPLGISPEMTEPPRLSLRPDQRRAGARSVGRSNEHEVIVGVHAGSGYRFRTWPERNFAQVLDSAAETFDTRIAVLGGPGDEARVDRIAALTRHPVRTAILRTVEGLAQALDALDVLICLDSGPMHVAGALDKDLVVLWGPGRLEMFGPRQPHTRVVCRWAPCMGCPQEGAPTRCSMGFAVDTTLCMSPITVEEVSAALGELLVDGRLPRRTC
jgi:ADP-heptose:LPS heptosyltransferase